MKKRVMCFLLALVLLLSFTGCQNEEHAGGEYQIFYLNMEKTKIEPEEYDSSGDAGESLIYELLKQLQSEPENS